jgi:NAD(P)-dependent dehydrogenase (short-subunit alcohol dehydrogenase family)
VIDTPIHTPVVSTMDDPAAFSAFMGNMAPVGRMGTGNDIAGAALFLASDDSSYVTGTEILVDGGLLAGVPFF